MLILQITTDIANMILAVVAVMVVTMIVFRTSKRLDTVYKFYLATAVTLAIAGFIRINEYAQLIPNELSDIIFIFSRTFATIFFILGSMVMLFIIDKESK